MYGIFISKCCECGKVYWVRIARASKWWCVSHGYCDRCAAAAKKMIDNYFANIRNNNR